MGIMALLRGLFFEFFLKEFFDFIEFRFDNDRAIGLIFIAFVIVLVILFRWIEGGPFSQFGDDRSGIVGLLFFDEGFSGFFLSLIFIEDCRAVLGTHVVALSIFGGGVVCGEKNR